MKKNSIRAMKKKLKRRKNWKYLKRKNLQGNKLVIGVLGIALLGVIHNIIVENTLFEDSDGANTPQLKYFYI